MTSSEPVAESRMGLGIAVYLAAMVLLAFGITLNAQTGLGVSPIVSVAYSISEASGLLFADMTFILYGAFVVAEIIIHSILGKGRKYFIRDILQLPLSLVFTRFMKLFQILFADVPSFPVHVRLLCLLIAIAATGTGAAATLSMRIIPNPGDGIVQALSDLSHRSVGLVKNIFDGVNVLIALAIGFIFLHSPSGVGIGTIIAFIGVGRFVALYNGTIGPRIAGKVFAA